MGAMILRVVAPYIAKGLALVGVLLGLYLYIQHIDASARADQKALDAGAVRAATLQADLNASEVARKIEAAQAQATKEANDALQPQLAAANDRAADYVVRLRRALTDKGSTGSTGLSQTASAAGLPGQTDRLALLDDDIHKCTAIVVRLQNAQGWAAKELSAPQTP